MRIIDEKGNLVSNPDLERGKLSQESRLITLRYEIAQPERGHYEVIAEYPNGGKDVEWIIDAPEKGSWKAYGEDGGEVETDVTVPDGAPRELAITEVEEYLRFVPYTEAELEEIARQKRLEEAETAKRARMEEASLAEQKRLAQEAEARTVAVTGLLEGFDGSVSIEDIMDAIAELGALIAEAK